MMIHPLDVVRFFGVRRSLLAFIFLMLAAAAPASSRAQEAGWSGNFAINPGFEEDFVNRNAEAHVLSFKGDWFYNQKDLIPDYWNLAQDAFSLDENSPHGGTRALKLADKQVARQSYPGAVYQEGGSAWAGPENKDIAVAHPERFKQSWRATVWCRGGGTIRLGADASGAGGASASAPNRSDWKQISVQLSPQQQTAPITQPMRVELVGPGEFDDVAVQEKLPHSPNLIPNSSFETLDDTGYPLGWSAQRKWRAIGPTYYVWTDWNHAFRENRGNVSVDPLVYHSGKQSLRFDVYPGDEKFIESDFIALNQATAEPIEIAAYVRADRIKLFDLRCVDEDGVPLPSYYPIYPENLKGNESATFGNGTFGWRYVRKFFAPPPQYGQDGKPMINAAGLTIGKPMKGVRVRVAARGFNAHTLDDSGTRSYACQVGTVWWDDLRVMERTSTASELSARGAKLQLETSQQSTSAVRDADLSLGERLYGTNRLALALTNNSEPGTFQLELTTTLPGQKPQLSQSPALQLAKGASGRLQAPYEISKLAGDLQQQGTLKLRVLRDGQPVTDTTYAFNTWPVVIDFDVARHYNLPAENPVTTSLNLGVAADTLSKIAKLELTLVKAADHTSVISVLPPVTNLSAAFKATVDALPKVQAESYEFNLPTPSWWTDRTNLLVTKLDLSALKVWPHDKPTRDTVLLARALDANGNVLFEDFSDGFCRIDAPPKQPPIQSVAVREDGAVLINGSPRFLTGATHQNTRITHSPQIIAQLGIMGHRMPQAELAKFDALQGMWQQHNLYALQMKPVSGAVGTVAHVDMTDAQKAELASFVQSGGMQSVVSINTGGWESHIPDDPASRQKHIALNDWVRQTTGRPIAWSMSGGYNAFNATEFPYYDINHAETEMWGPMDYNVIYTPYIRKLKKTPSAWVYLPQLYDNTPFERLRFETYENIIRGSAGVSMIQGIGDPSFMRGLAGELRYLEGPLNSQEEAPAVTLDPDISHKVTRFNGKTYVLATNCGPKAIGRWKWNRDVKQSGAASHEGDSANMMWQRPAGMRIHGFRGLPMPELIRAGDKIVQYVWIDPRETPQWVMLLVRGDGKFIHNAVVGGFDYNAFRADYGNIFLYSELNHATMHEINSVMDPPTYERAVKLMGKAWADQQQKTADKDRAMVDKLAHKAEDFRILGGLPAAGQWYRIEFDADAAGLTGKLVDGFAYITKNGRALWDYTALERGGKMARVFCEDTVGIDRAKLASVRIGIPGLAAGTKVTALFEDRVIASDDGGFIDNFEGTDTYGYESGGVEGDMFGYVKDPDRELPRMMPSGYGYNYGPTAVHIYEIPSP